MEGKKELTLLGIWNVLPIESWGWFCREAVEHLFKLTGRRLRVVTMIKDDLHYECFLTEDVLAMKKSLELMKHDEQIIFMNEMCEDYYSHAEKLQNHLNRYKTTGFSSLSDKQLIVFLRGLSEIWPKLTMQIWYSVLLDIWYPSSEEGREIKEIGGKARDHLGKLHAFSNEIEQKVYHEASKRLSMSVHGIEYLFPHELIEALENKESCEDLTNARRKLCVTITLDEDHVIYHGKKALHILDVYNVPQEGKDKRSLLQGLPANTGKVSGVARVIKRDDDFDKFKKGEVLVTLQTMVHYLPLMEQSVAILTEFGGLTSHAAIVSRELNKPCIVGIENLISSINDGDLVEVDADNGIVKILK